MQAIFDQVCQLREKKLDLEEATAEEKKAAEALKKEFDALTKKGKVIDSGLMTAEADLEEFQVRLASIYQHYDASMPLASASYFITMPLTILIRIPKGLVG